MTNKCAFQFDDGRQCRCWAKSGSNFCNNHQPEVHSYEPDGELHPLARLATREDLFDVIRETLNAARQGRVTPGQAYAVGYLAQLWLQVHRQLGYPEFVDGGRRMPLPVKIDEEASTEALPPPRSIEEAQERMREAQAALPPFHTPEQRAELHRQVAEIKARSEARLAADKAALANSP